MPCALPAPRWVILHRAGLQASIDVPAQNATALNWGRALPGGMGTFVFYNVYFSDNLTTLFDRPKVFSTFLSTLVSNTLAPDGYYFAIRASQQGIADDFNTLAPLALNPTSFSYPSPPVSTASFSTIALDGYLEVTDTTGFPPQDGYLLIGEEVVQYSALTIFGGGPAFEISNHDPFGCNDGYGFAAGETIELFRGFEDVNTTTFQPRIVCGFTMPEWAELTNGGIKAARDLGVGSAVELFWHPATSPIGTDVLFNVYSATTIEDLFTNPVAITAAEEVVFPGLRPGDGYYFGVRATYFTETIDITALNQLSENLYEYPTSTVVDEFDGYYDEDETGPLVVNSTVGYPPSGFIKVGSEVMAYGGKTPSTFIISQRDYFGFGRQTAHANGTAVEMFRGFEDPNTAQYRVTPTWERSDGPWLIPDGYELPGSMQDADGYRAWKEDLLNEDHSVFEEENIDVPAYNQCGYRSRDFFDLLTGNACSTYAGGRQNGFGGGIDLAESNLQREEFLAAHTGEPWTVIRERTIGRQCPRFSLRHEAAHERCSLCYGTRIYGGYQKFQNPRRWRPDRDNPNGFVAMRTAPYKNDLPTLAERGRAQVDELTLWLPPLPSIKKRDILIRYISDEDKQIIGEEFRYEVLHVVRNKILLNIDGRQEVVIRKLDKTHEVYKFPNPLVPEPTN